MADLSRFLVDPDMSIRAVMVGMGNSNGISLVVNEQRRLISTITDGDIRRAILAGTDLEQPISTLLDKVKLPKYSQPITAPVNTPTSHLIQVMTENQVRHIPLTNAFGEVVEVATLSELVRDYELPMTAVVMAGGYGTRLRPLTNDLPKPMLPLGDRPLLEHIVDQLKTAGIRKLNITTHYKAHIIEEHFKDGREFGVDINYVDEGEPLGTAGALSLLEDSNDPLLVINGDIVTKVDLRAMLDFHKEHDAEMTVAVRQHETHVPYGVVELDGVDITGIAEKPVYRFLVNAGIYLLNPQACRRVPFGQRYDMPELISEIRASGMRVIGFPIQEYWIDVGQLDDYTRAQADVLEGELQR
jgi:dTDP-glucose pyrophosphorylase/CBS domain-containing protein